MTINPLAASKTLTLQAAATITGATNASPIAITTSAAHGQTTGDIVVISGVVGNTNANGKFVVTVVDSTHYTLNGTTGNAAYTSGGTTQHVGFQTAAFTCDNTVFSSTTPDYTVKFRIASLSAGTGVRALFEDSGDSGVTWQPGPFYSRYGAMGLTNDSLFSAKREDWFGCKLGTAGDRLRINVYLEGAYGVAPTVGSSVQFNSWLEY